MTAAASSETANAAEAKPLHLQSFPAAYGHVPSLDGLRAISIAFVLLGHLVNASLFPGGLGVLIFFVISGFLITRLMLVEYKATGTMSLRNFYLRRIFRLYPAVLTYTAIIIVTFLLLLPDKVNAREPLSALF